jgi:amino acid adenylation domain-containing protein/non-ribosomal peptide synthase protein (TIGR01720 family)
MNYRQSQTPHESEGELNVSMTDATDFTSIRQSTVKRELLARRRRSDYRENDVLKRRDSSAPVEATAQQRSLWFLDRYLGPGANSAYNLHHAIQLRGVLDIEMLVDCLRQLVVRHDALRTTFVYEADIDENDLGGSLVLRVASPPTSSSFTLQINDVSQDELTASLLKESSTPFDLATGPLFRPVLFRLGKENHVLLLMAHHTVFDGGSLAVVQDELAEFYAASVTGRVSAVPPLPIDFSDWAAHTHSEGYQTAVVQRLDAAVARLKDAPALLNMPTDRPADPDLSTEGNSVSIRLHENVSLALSRLCLVEGVTLFTTVLTAYQILLSRWSGHDDICVGIPLAGRGRVELVDLVGCFVSTGVVRTKLDSSLTFRELLGGVAEDVHKARADGDVPFEQLVAGLHVERMANRNPVFQAFLDVIPKADVREGWPKGLIAQHLPIPVRQAKFDLSLSVIDGANGMTADLNYRTDLFDKETATAMLDQLTVLLERFAENPDAIADGVSAMSETAHKQWWDDGSGAVVDVPDSTLLQALTAASASTPDAIAVRASDEELTYAELDRHSTALAHRLALAGAGRGDVVIVAIPRSLDLAVALGGVLRAGAAYLPVDLDHPIDRIRFILDDARPICVLTTSASAAAFAETDMAVLEIDGWREAADCTPPRASTVAFTEPHPDDVAYVIYTSGSTGHPKGVEVSHRGILNRLRWMQHTYTLVPGERVLQKTPTTFDVSVWELFWPLISGSTLVFAPPGAHRDPLEIAQLVIHEQITTLHFVPSMLRVFLEEPQSIQTRTHLRRVFCSGEELPASTVALFAQVLPGVELHNLYGPTEASIDVTAWKCDPGSEEGTPPIGHPIWNTNARVLDKKLAPVPIGVAGELYLSGVQLALGYRLRSRLTAEHFLPDPWGTPGSRMYRTGDVVRRRPNGALIFLGRIDHQIKLHGQRIELGEIEHVLLRDPAVSTAVAVVRSDHSDMAHLVAYVVQARGKHRLDIPGLIAQMRAILPAVMVPEDVVVLDSFSHTPSGKIDRKELPSPAATLSPAKRHLLADRSNRNTPRQVPTDARTATLCDLFARLLGLHQVDPDDDFFRLGGDSIGSIRLTSAARGAGIVFSERMVFEHRSPRALAAVSTKPTSDTFQAEIPETDIGVIALTPIMRWWRSNGGPTTGFYQSALIQLPSGTSESLIVTVLTALATRHSMLRARLTTDDHGNENLTVLPSSDVDTANWLTQVDECTFDDEQRLAANIALRLNPAHSMVAAVWTDGGSSKNVQLLLAVHHLATDGVSWRVLLDDIVTGMNDAAEDRPIHLPEVRSSFRTWTNYLEREASKPARLAELDTWTRILSASEKDFGRALNPATDTAGSAGKLVCEISSEHTIPLLNVVPDLFRAGVDHVLLCALALAMREWRAQRGNPSSVLRVMLERHGRHDVESRFDLSRTVGWFTARHPAELELASAENASAALHAVKNQLRALPDNGLGYGLLRYLANDTSQTLAALEEPAIAFNYLGRFHLDHDRPEGNSVVLSKLDGGISDDTPLTNALDITALAEEGPDGVLLRTTFTWAPSVIDERSIGKLMDHWVTSLSTMAALANDPYAGGTKASDLFMDIDQDELDALHLELETDWK